MKVAMKVHKVLTAAIVCVLAHLDCAAAQSFSFSFDDDVAFTSIGNYPDGPSDAVIGVVTVEEAPTGGVVFSGYLEFPTDEYDGIEGGVHVHAGTTCDNADEVYYHFCPWRGTEALNSDGTSPGPYSCLTDPVDASDPWLTLYTVEGNKAKFSELIVGNMIRDSADFNVYRPGSRYSVEGLAVVVHIPDGTGGGTRIGCGLLALGEYTGSFNFDLSFSF